MSNGVTCHQAPAWPLLCPATSPASVCEHELRRQSVSEFLSTTRSGSPPQPTVEEDVAPQRRTPLTPLMPPPPTLFVCTAHVPCWTQGSNWQLPLGTFSRRLRFGACSPGGGVGATGSASWPGRPGAGAGPQPAAGWVAQQQL